MNYEEGININNIFFIIFSRVFQKSSNNSNTTGNNTQESNSSVEENLNQNLKHLLLINLYKIIQHLGVLRYTRYFLKKLVIYSKMILLLPYQKYLYKLLYCL